MPPRTTRRLTRSAIHAVLFFGLATSAGAQGAPLSGYMEVHYNKIQPQDPVLDFRPRRADVDVGDREAQQCDDDYQLS